MPSVRRRSKDPGVRRWSHARFPRVLRLAAWLLPYVLLAHLILGGVAAGALAAQANLAQAAGAGSAEAFCSAHADTAPDAPAGAGHVVHCLLCPLSGTTPLLPAPAADMAPAPSHGRATAARLRRAPSAPAPRVHEHARPRAPPVSALA